LQGRGSSEASLAFDSIDKNHDGVVDYNEFEHAYQAGETPGGKGASKAWTARIEAEMNAVEGQLGMKSPAGFQEVRARDFEWASLAPTLTPTLTLPSLPSLPSLLSQ